MRRLFLLATPLFLVLSHAGCSTNPAEGWKMGHSQSDAHATVAVPLFRNTSYERGLERELGRALLNEIETTTP